MNVFTMEIYYEKKEHLVKCLQETLERVKKEIDDEPRVQRGTVHICAGRAVADYYDEEIDATKEEILDEFTEE